VWLGFTAWTKSGYFTASSIVTACNVSARSP
jgi:hypothetical protein